MLTESFKGPSPEAGLPNDNLFSVMEPKIQAGTQGPGKNPGNTSRSSENVIVGDQSGLNNFVNKSVISRCETFSCHP